MMQRIVWPSLVATLFAAASIIIAVIGGMTDLVIASGFFAVTYAVLATREK